MKSTKEKELAKTLKNIIIKRKVKDTDTDYYLRFIKSLLFFTGKQALALSFFRRSIIDKETYLGIFKNKLSAVFPKIVNQLEELYGKGDSILEDEKRDIIEAIEMLDNKELENFSLGKLYESFITAREKKYLGQVYTPDYIVIYMINDCIKDDDIIKNPYFKVLDPACGGGYFLVEAFNRIKNIIVNNYNKIIEKNPMVKEELEDGIDKFIIKHNIWGTDIDEFAVFMTTITLLLKPLGDYKLSPNVFVKDILLDNFNGMTFDLVVGNPPYIGHKKIDKKYRDLLNNFYRDVYSDKADISYCFFKKGHELLKKEGKLIFITSRYFQEALSAVGLRNYIKGNFYIDKIVDFYGVKVFKGIGISPSIIKCIKNELLNSHIHIYKLREKLTTTNAQIDIEDEKFFEKFTLNQGKLMDKGWLLVDEMEKNLFSKVDSQGTFLLNEICYCKQGIITGCDKAFIVDKTIIEEEKLEKDIIRPWIKNSDIDSYKEVIPTKYIIYTDLIKDISNYKNIMKHLEPYTDKLNKRRECIKGIRKWYQLQWGREISTFEVPKIIFPFKSTTNKFTIDYNGSLCSADVYIINIKDEYKEKISFEYLLAYLNSSVFEFYFKSVAKKLGEKLYEYYPNKIMNLKIKFGNDRGLIVDRVRKILDFNRQLNHKETHKEELLQSLKEEIKFINNYFYKLYCLNEDEIDLIHKKLGKISD